ncbi:MAG: hypothetical protein ABSG59_08725 [Verrucomicrobiota bacterium]|jgi:hypothetical protein
MEPEKAEFRRLIGMMEWSQSEAARRLHKTPSAINHLVNPTHPNKPTQTTLQLLKLIIASERPDLFEAAFELKENPIGGGLEQIRLSAKERELVERMRRLTAGERAKVYAVLNALLDTGGPKPAKK